MNATALSGDPTMAVVGSLTVLYDERCAVCRRTAAWLAGQDQLVPLVFVPAASRAARERFPALDHSSTLGVVTVVTDRGLVYRGEHAWVMCLWCLTATRSLALDLAEGRRSMSFRAVRGIVEMLRSEGDACTL
jgi:predicted DCC family thiol-disulfide oxidoreductase YuxK